MCNVHCVQRYCDCSPGTSALSVIIFRFMILILLIVAPYCAICSVLDEFYQISGDITVANDFNYIYDVVDTNDDNPYKTLSDIADLIDTMNFATTNGPAFSNLTVTIVCIMYNIYQCTQI